MTYDFAALAERDMQRHFEYLDARNPQAARDWLRELLRMCQHLADHPHAGHEQFHLRPRLQSYSFEDYVLYFRAKRNGIEVARILHGRQDKRKVFPKTKSRRRSK